MSNGSVLGVSKNSWRPKMPAFKLVIAVLTAHHPSRWHRRQVAKQNFLKDCPIPYKFVFGDAVRVGDWDYTGLRDEEILHAPGSDAKDHLPLKNQAAFRWALEQGADAIIRVMDDTWLNVDRMLKAGLEQFDLAGAFPMKFKLGGTFSVPWLRMGYPHGGCGIWLSRKSMEMLVADVWDPDYLKSWPERMDVGWGITYPTPKIFWDDHWVGEVLQGNLAYDDPLRSQPWAAYTANGISVFEDEFLFYNDEIERPLTVHDPGVHKIQSRDMDDVIEQARQRNLVANVLRNPLNVIDAEPTNA
jgi:hypothetical protein